MDKTEVLKGQFNPESPVPRLLRLSPPHDPQSWLEQQVEGLLPVRITTPGEQRVKGPFMSHQCFEGTNIQ